MMAGMGKSLTFFYSVFLDGDTVIERQAQEMHILLKSPFTTKESNRQTIWFSMCILTFMQVQRERGRVKMTRRKESRVRAREQSPGPSGSAAIRKNK